MKARLIIKGDRFQAARAAADRGFGLAFEQETSGDYVSGLPATTTTGLTNSTTAKLNEWFCEDGEAPFPAGALLLWTPT